MKLKLALLAAAGSMAVVSAATAQENTGYYGALGAGYVFENDNIDFESDDANPAFDSDIEAGDNVAIYGALGRYFDNGFRGELELATRTQNIEGIPGDGLGFAGFPSASNLGDITVSTLMLNAYKDFSFDAAGAFHPYLGLGIGAARVRPEFNNISSPDSSASGPAFSNRVVVGDKDFVPAYQGMAGLTYDFTDNMMVDLRYRYLQTSEVDYGGFINNEFASLSSEYNAHEVVAGFRWNFGPEPVSAPDPEPVQYKSCWDGSRVQVTMDCPPQIEDADDMPSTMDPQVVYFDYDKSNLTPAANEVIEVSADQALEMDVMGVTVAGHTDTAGSSAYNQALSARRANAVRDALVANGISSSMISIETYGESRPAKETGDGVAEPLNRRAEIMFSF